MSETELELDNAGGLPLPWNETSPVQHANYGKYGAWSGSSGGNSGDGCGRATAGRRSSTTGGRRGNDEDSDVDVSDANDDGVYEASSHAGDESKQQT